MISKLLRSSCKQMSGRNPALRFKEVYEYLCLREINSPTDGGTALKNIEAAGKKYHLTLPLTLELIYYLQNDPDNYHAFLKKPDLQLLIPILEQDYSNSPMKHNDMTLAEFRESLWNRYPELVYYLRPSDTKLQAIKDLEEIFIKMGPTGVHVFHNKMILDCVPLFVTKINEHLESLEKQVAKKEQGSEEGQKEVYTKRASKLFDDIIALIKANPSLHYGRILAFLEISKGIAPEAEPASIGSKEDHHRSKFDFFKNEELDLPLLVRERNLKLQQRYERRWDDQLSS